MDGQHQENQNVQEPVDNQRPELQDAAFYKERREKQEDGELVKIGDVYMKIGRPSLTAMTEKGILPADLVARVAGVSEKAGKGRALTSKDIEDSREFDKVVVTTAVKAPVIKDAPPDEVNYDNGEISIEDLSDDEVQEIVLYVRGGEKMLNSFRIKQQSLLVGLGMQEVSGPSA